MSDFIGAYWSVFIAAITLIGIVWCVWLLSSQRKVTVSQAADGSVTDTGHVWDGDLRELNNPLPRWWAWMFLISCVFGLVYLVLYPGLGSYPGVLGYTTDNAYVDSVVEANEDLKPIYAKYMQLDVQQVAADPKAREMGQRLYLNYCAQCHGSDAGGSKGFPNLTDNDWLYGGSPEMIKTAILQGRAGVMPAYAHLSKDEIADLVNYVRSLSGLPVNSAKAERGGVLFAANCVACHATDGKGNTAMGAPNLTDKIWLYGSTEATVTETLTKGRNGQMPAHEAILTPEKVQLIAAYVWSLTNIKTDQAK
ncbi:MAG: cytochrome-c oxidase, cbb3-type subunit III [Polynucleobacter sp.]|jgi:cytochrome c oxidase cbb3-type subunit 3|nr:cytochrome-c oxidase, cbb3-type subunit III [Polynucleobacter sp.]MDZ4056343.1 cytochrome-c oxidase, cbb3-type subunit III [Polynucleobacter sp.]